MAEAEVPVLRHVTYKLTFNLTVIPTQMGDKRRLQSSG